MPTAKKNTKYSDFEQTASRVFQKAHTATKKRYQKG